MTLKLPDSTASDPVSALLQTAADASPMPPEAPQPAAGFEDAPSGDAFDGSGTFTGERVDVAGIGGMLGKLGRGLGEKVVKKVAEMKPPVADTNPVYPAHTATPAAPKPAVPAQPAYDAARARTIAESPPALPANRNRTTRLNFNTKRMETSDDVVALIDEVAADNAGFMDARRGVVSNVQTANEADGISLESLLGRKPGEAWNAAQLQAGKQILMETSKRIVELKNAWQSGRATTDEDLLSFRQLLSKHAAVQAQMAGAAAEAGRALQIMGAVTAKAGKLRAREVRDALDALGGRGATEDILSIMKDIGDDPARIGEVARKTAWRRTAEAVSEWTINSMLSSPPTHMANISGNVLAMSLHPVERATASLIGKGLGMVSGHQPTAQIGEAAQMFGVLQGMKDGFRLAGRALKGGHANVGDKLELFDPAITASKFELDENGLFGKAFDLFGEWYVRLPGKALAAQDAFFGSVASRMELNARAYRQAVEEGHAGPDLARRTAELVNDPPDEMLADAQSFARYSTFTNSLWEGRGLLSKAGQAGQTIFADHPIAKLTVAPFIRTPVNIAKYIVERSPLEVLSPDFWDAMRGTDAAKRELALARMGLGTLVATSMMSEYFTADDGGNVTRRITGNGPDDPQARAALLTTGWQPNSVLVDGQYVSYNRADPFGAIVGMYANALDILEYSENDDDSDQVAAAVVLGTGEALMSKSYLSSLSEFFDVVSQKPGAGATSFISGQIGKAVPAWLGTLARATDTDASGNPIVRETRTGGALDQVLKTIKARTPGLSETLPPKRDLWGNPVVRGGKVSVLTPFSVSEGKNDPIMAKLIQLDAVPDKPSKIVTVDGHAFDLTELDDGAGFVYDRYLEAVGKYSRQKLEALGITTFDATTAAQDESGMAENVEDHIKKVYRETKQKAKYVALAQAQGLISKDDPLPKLKDVPDLVKKFDIPALLALAKEKKLGARRLPPHLQPSLVPEPQP